VDLIESLYARLKSDSGVIAAAGVDDAGVAKVYPAIAPQSIDAPFHVFQVIAGITEHAMGADGGVRGTLVQFASWGKTREQSRALAEAVNASLKDFSGTAMGGSGGVNVSRIFEETEYMEDFEEGAAQEGLWVTRQDMTVWYE